MSSAAVRDVIYRHFEEDGTVDRIREGKARDAALKMLGKGYSPDEVADNVDMPVEWVENLLKHLKAVKNAK